MSRYGTLNRKEKLSKIENQIIRLNISKRTLPKDTFNHVVAIGKGSFGYVYKAEIHGSPLAIKETKARSTTNRVSNSSYWEEFKMLELLKKEVQKDACPNFPLVYGSFFCESFLSFKSPCLLTLVELMDGTLSDIKLNTKEQSSVLFQILAALHTLQNHYVMVQNDVKAENILFSYVRPGGSWEYVIYGTSFFVENCGIVVYLNDFGVANSFSPKYTTTSSLGERNGIIEGGIFVPFSTALFVTSTKQTTPNKTRFPWLTEDKFSRNNFQLYRGRLLNVFPSIPLKLKDFEKESLVPVEFFSDTQDAIRLFLGGKRTRQPGCHQGVKNLCPKLKRVLEQYKTERGVWITKWPLDSVHYFLAGYLIFKIYTLRTSPPQGVLARYTISTTMY